MNRARYRIGRLAVIGAALVTLVASAGAARAASWTVTHEELTQGTDFRSVSGPVTWTYGYWAGSGNSMVVVTMREVGSGFSWAQVQSSSCPSQLPYCYASGHVAVPSGVRMTSIVVSSQPSDGVASPGSSWVYLPVADLHCTC